MGFRTVQYVRSKFLECRFNVTKITWNFWNLPNNNAHNSDIWNSFLWQSAYFLAISRIEKKHGMKMRCSYFLGYSVSIPTVANLQALRSRKLDPKFEMRLEPYEFWSIFFKSHCATIAAITCKFYWVSSSQFLVSWSRRAVLGFVYCSHLREIHWHDAS